MLIFSRLQINATSPPRSTPAPPPSAEDIPRLLPPSNGVLHAPLSIQVHHPPLPLCFASFLSKGDSDASCRFVIGLLRGLGQTPLGDPVIDSGWNRAAPVDHPVGHRKSHTLPPVHDSGACEKGLLKASERTPPFWQLPAPRRTFRALQGTVSLPVLPRAICLAAPESAQHQVKKSGGLTDPPERLSFRA